MSVPAAASAPAALAQAAPTPTIVSDVVSSALAADSTLTTGASIPAAPSASRAVSAPAVSAAAKGAPSLKLGGDGGSGTTSDEDWDAAKDSATGKSGKDKAAGVVEGVKAATASGSAPAAGPASAGGGSSGSNSPDGSKPNTPTGPKRSFELSGSVYMPPHQPSAAPAGVAVAPAAVGAAAPVAAAATSVPAAGIPPLALPAAVRVARRHSQSTGSGEHSKRSDSSSDGVLVEQPGAVASAAAGAVAMSGAAADSKRVADSPSVGFVVVPAPQEGASRSAESSPVLGNRVNLLLATLQSELARSASRGAGASENADTKGLGEQLRSLIQGVESLIQRTVREALKASSPRSTGSESPDISTGDDSAEREKRERKLQDELAAVNRQLAVQNKAFADQRAQMDALTRKVDDLTRAQDQNAAAVERAMNAQAASQRELATKLEALSKAIGVAGNDKKGKGVIDRKAAADVAAGDLKVAADGRPIGADGRPIKLEGEPKGSINDRLVALEQRHAQQMDDADDLVVRLKNALLPAYGKEKDDAKAQGRAEGRAAGIREMRRRQNAI